MMKQSAWWVRLLQGAIILLIISAGSLLALAETRRWQLIGGVILGAVSIGILTYSVRMLNHEQEL